MVEQLRLGLLYFMTMMGGVYVTCFFLFMRVCAISGDATERFVLRMKSGVLIAEASSGFSDPQYVGALAERRAASRGRRRSDHHQFQVRCPALVSASPASRSFLPMLLGRL